MEMFIADNDTRTGYVSLLTGLKTSEGFLTDYDIIAGIKHAMMPIYFVHPNICKNLPIHGNLRLFWKDLMFKFSIQKDLEISSFEA